ncbi:MAG: hypothetical protein O7H41_17595 [Planctomycetota bacterium]|nr:hypothetical protein [Planctomycetota bacterium]
MTTEYDSREALDLLSRAADELNPDRNLREDAGTRLLEQFQEQLNGEAGFVTERDIRTGGVWLALPGVGKVKVAHISNGDFKIYSSESGPAADLRFVYNALEKRLEALDRDEYTRPLPGQPDQRRSALAVLVESAIEGLRPADSLPASDTQ